MSNYIKDFYKSLKGIKEYYNYLVNETQKEKKVGNINELLLDNYYLFLEYKNTIIKSKKSINKVLKNNEYLYDILKKIAAKNNYSVTYRILIRELNAYQRDNNIYFTYEIISNIINILFLIYIERFYRITKELKENYLTKEKVITSINSSDSLFDFNINDYNYIYEINMAIKNNDSLFKKFSNYLDENSISLNNVLDIEYQRKSDIDILTNNIFNNIKEMALYDKENLIKSISFSEKQLINDKIYLHMTDNTKQVYRKRIGLNAKKKKKSEKEYIDNIMVQYAKDGNHIGFRIFNTRNQNKFSILYLFLNLIITIILSACISNYFIPNKILGFILLLIVNFLLTRGIINECLKRIIPKDPILMMDYDKKIPKESQSMVVMPMVLNKTSDIKNAFDKLEKYYISNRSDDLFFTLLGDISESDKEYLEIDNEIKEYGIKYASELNEKYNKKVFSFIYRKRVWNNKEKKYIGYEKRRGALLQFNRILLKVLTKSEREKYFNAITLDTYNMKIKYVIVVDYNVESVTSFSKLIGAMDHPLNRPILNDEGNKVISGYGLMQVKINLDVTAKNKNIFTGLFEKNNNNLLYQNLFNSSNYNGLGIYDLYTSDECLPDRFKDNRYINTNILEGYYLRCAYLDFVTFTKNESKNFLSYSIDISKMVMEYTEMINYILPKIRNNKEIVEKNNLTLFNKLHLITNFLKIFLYPFLLIISLLTIYISKYKLLMHLFIMITVFISNLEYTTLKKSIIRSILDFALIPCYAINCLISFIITFYRVLITHKNLISFNINLNYLKLFFSNILIAIIYILSKNIYGIIIGVFNIIVLIIIYLLNKNRQVKKINLLDRENEELENIAKKCWNYFKENLCLEYNYLIPNNYQELRENKFDLKTTPTDIGFSLVSVCSAYKLGFVDLNEAFSYINNILVTVLELKKWNGHLYNYYDIKSKKVIEPYFISTTESGNFVTSLIVIKNFLKDKNIELTKICDELIKNTDYSKLYNKNGLLSKGYSDTLKVLSNNYHRKLLDSSRLTTYVAISKGDIPSSSWDMLDKNIPSFGSLYEYMMPNLFMNDYENTYLEQAYKYMFKTQCKLTRNTNIKLPWGISDAFISRFDEDKNYIYEKFLIPIHDKNIKRQNIVVSPYSSIFFLNKYPKTVCENITKYRQINMIFKYGFYESYDYNSKNIVRGCHSKNQSIILISITNYLKDNTIKKYFNDDNSIKSYDYLLKDDTNIKIRFDKELINCLGYKYKKETNMINERVYNTIPYLSNISILSNRRYSLLLDDKGNSISKVKNVKLNRVNLMEQQSYGTFLYIKDIETNKIWSNTYAPLNKENDKYKVTFSNYLIKYLRTDDEITTQTEIIVTRDDNVEIRKYTFNNDSDKTKILELTTYMEPSILDEDLDRNILTNSSLETKIIDNNAMIAVRTNEEICSKLYLINRLVVNNPKGNYSYCNDKLEFIGRGNTLENPIAINNNLIYKPSTDVILSIRNKIEIAPNSKTEAYIISGFGRNMEQINKILNDYSDKNQIDRAFIANESMKKLYTRTQNLTNIEINNYNTMYNYLYRSYITPISIEKKNYLKENTLVLKDLEKYGITGKRPIILINNSENNISFIKEILKLFEYFKYKLIYVDIVIICRDRKINDIVNNYLFRMNKENNFNNDLGKIVILNNVDEDEKTLLKVVSNLVFNIKSNYSLTELLNHSQTSVIDRVLPSKDQDNIEIINSEKLSYNNTYGGFVNNGREYVITNNNTPRPWCNILSNKTLTSIVSNNGCGYTFYKNSNDYQITMNRKNLVSNYKSEGIKINNLVFNPSKCIHGFGYTILESETEKFNQSLCEFIPREDNVKVYLFSIKNKTKQDESIDVSFFINHVLGETKTNHILTEYMKNDNYLRLRNVCSNDYSNITVFLSSSERINNAYDGVYEKSIQTSIIVPAEKSKEIVFYLGTSTTDLDLLTLLYKYKKINLVKEEFDKVKKYWYEQTSKIEVKTKDTTLNYMLNGWYIYKSMTSRISNDRISYKNYVQDIINLCILDSDFAKKQILLLASFQFIEGDIFKYWIKGKCLRSKNNSSHLWLIFAVIFYIEYSGDVDILKKSINYIEGETLVEHEQERIITYKESSKKDTLLNHLLLGLDISLNTGKHGLLLINDTSSLSKEDTSTSFFFILIVKRFLELNKKYHLGIDSTKYEKFINKLSKNINNVGYDKNYYLDGFYEEGIYNDNNLIHLNSQSLSILSNVIPNKLKNAVFSSVEDKLVDKDNKIIKSVNNSITNINYTYDIGLYIMSLLKEKRNNTAYKYYQMFNPINRTLDSKATNIYKFEPYNLVDNILENGSGENIFNTTVTSLFYKIGIENILGLKKRGDKLYIEPHLPSNFDNYELNYKYKDSIYNIKVEISNLKQIVYDGNITAATYIKLDNKKKKHTVLVFVKDDSDD